MTTANALRDSFTPGVIDPVLFGVLDGSTDCSDRPPPGMSKQ